MLDPLPDVPETPDHCAVPGLPHVFLPFGMFPPRRGCRSEPELAWVLTFTRAAPQPAGPGGAQCRQAEGECLLFPPFGTPPLMRSSVPHPAGVTATRRSAQQHSVRVPRDSSALASEHPPVMCSRGARSHSNPRSHCNRVKGRFPKWLPPSSPPSPCPPPRGVMGGPLRPLKLRHPRARGASLGSTEAVDLGAPTQHPGSRAQTLP